MWWLRYCRLLHCFSHVPWVDLPQFVYSSHAGLRRVRPHDLRCSSSLWARASSLAPGIVGLLLAKCPGFRRSRRGMHATWAMHARVYLRGSSLNVHREYDSHSPLDYPGICQQLMTNGWTVRGLSWETAVRSPLIIHGRVCGSGAF